MAGFNQGANRSFSLKKDHTGNSVQTEWRGEETEGELRKLSQQSQKPRRLSSPKAIEENEGQSLSHRTATRKRQDKSERDPGLSYYSYILYIERAT